MYVRSKFRGEKLGNLMIEEVIRVSKENGYSKLYLDTAHFMSSAISIYEDFGFKETSSYPESVHPKELLIKMIYMMKKFYPSCSIKSEMRFKKIACSHASSEE